MPIDLAVTGAVPTSLSGRYVRVGGGSVDAVTLDGGRALSHARRSIPTYATNLISFGSSIFAFGHGALAYELGGGLDTMRPVDLAGARRNLTACPKVDATTGELHLLTFRSDAAQLHVTVSPGGLTRTIRLIDNAPNPIRGLELTRDNVVLLADGFVGVASRAGITPRTNWFAIDTKARELAVASVHGETVVVYATGPSLERWTLHPRATSVGREVLDATPQPFSTHNCRSESEAHHFLWTAGSGAVHKHDLLIGVRESHDFGDGRHPGDLVFVADPNRSTKDDIGWLVGFVHDETNPKTDFVVLDAHAIERPAVAVVHTPRRIPNAGHGTWVPMVRI